MRGKRKTVPTMQMFLINSLLLKIIIKAMNWPVSLEFTYFRVFRICSVFRINLPQLLSGRPTNGSTRADSYIYTFIMTQIVAVISTGLDRMKRLESNSTCKIQAYLLPAHRSCYGMWWRTQMQRLGGTGGTGLLPGSHLWRQWGMAGESRQGAAHRLWNREGVKLKRTS